MSAIPTSVREAVSARDRGRCLICGARGYEIHHRRRRREGGHGLENCILVCRTCHAMAHSGPAVARDNGWIVAVHSLQAVADRPIRTWWGWALLTPDGDAVSTEAATREEEA